MNLFVWCRGWSGNSSPKRVHTTSTPELPTRLTIFAFYNTHQISDALLQHTCNLKVFFIWSPNERRRWTRSQCVKFFRGSFFGSSSSCATSRWLLQSTKVNLMAISPCRLPPLRITPTIIAVTAMNHVWDIYSNLTEWGNIVFIWSTAPC